jgi:hypothetical protein
VRTEAVSLADTECNSANNTDTNGNCLIYAYIYAYFYANGDSYGYPDNYT